MYLKCTIKDFVANATTGGGRGGVRCTKVRPLAGFCG
jgi:hypothetical protein